jgi:hypothetical protein
MSRTNSSGNCTGVIPAKAFFPPDQRPGKGVGRLKPAIALSGSSKRRATTADLLDFGRARSLIFRRLPRARKLYPGVREVDQVLNFSMYLGRTFS